MTLTHLLTRLKTLLFGPESEAEPKYVGPANLIATAPQCSTAHIERYECPEQPGQYRVHVYQDWSDEEPLIVILDGPNAGLWASRVAEMVDKRMADFECSRK